MDGLQVDWMICVFIPQKVRASCLREKLLIDGNGDLSLSIDAQFPADTHDNSISAHFTFKKYGVEYDVSDLNDSRITIDNGQLLSFPVRVQTGRLTSIRALIRVGLLFHCSRAWALMILVRRASRCHLPLDSPDR